MAKFIGKVIIFFALVAIIDIACGFGFDFLKSHAKGGDTQKNYYIGEICEDDILILGSSRAARHYDPEIIKDSIGMSCYNCGEPGCGIITAYARYGLVRTRHKPKLVIYEITPSFDYFKTDDYSKYLGRVRQYANKPNVRKMFIDLSDNLEFLRLISKMYTNNSFIVHNVVDNFLGRPNNGYSPLNGILKLDTEPPLQPEKIREIDSLKLSYVEKLVIELKNDSIPFCFMASPRFIDPQSALKQEIEFEPVKFICDKYHIPFYNHTFCDGISNDKTLFHDFNHLNQEGAESYSRIVSLEFKNVIKYYSNND